jgi:EPS-associated MarR family transcriptional regulator
MNEIEQLHAERSLLEAVAQGEHANQRQLSRAIGLSLGKTHYLLKELVDRGLIKVGNFNRSRNKLGYAYLLTPSGVKEKFKITKKFLEAKEKEYEILRQQIEALKGEIGLGDSVSGSMSREM